MRQKSSQKLMRWQAWLVPRPIDGMAGVLYLGVLFVYSYFTWSGVYPITRPLVGTALMALAIMVMIAIDRLEYRYYGEHPPWPVTITLLLVRMAVIMMASLSDGFGFLPYETYLPIFIPFTFFLLSGSSNGLSGVIWMFYLMDRWRTSTFVEFQRPNEPTFIFYVTFSMMLLFISSIAFLIRQERSSRMKAEKLLAELELSHERLQKYAAQVTELATIEERNRLAREIHDSLGHYMTVINVQLEKAIVFRDRKPGEADQAVKDAKHLAAEALKDVRLSVGTLRSAPETFLLSESLAGLVSQMQKSKQFMITLDIEGDESGFSRQSLVTLYRAAQEGLTNIQKHAQASHVTVQIKLKEQEATLAIVDNGQGFDLTTLTAKTMQTHYGLQGMRERLELIHGSFKLESSPKQGTTLRVTVPKSPLALMEG